MERFTLQIMVLTQANSSLVTLSAVVSDDILVVTAMIEHGEKTRQAV